MALPRNEKLIRGNYDALSEEEKKNKIKLNNEYYVVYPLFLLQNMFSLKPELLNKSTNDLKRDKNAAKAELAKEEVNNDFKKQGENRDKFFINGSSLLAKDKRFLLSDSPEMRWVKTTLAALNNVLDSSLTADGFLKANGHLDNKALAERVDKAYTAFFEAAENYLNSRRSTSKTAMRRKNLVIDVLNSARRSHNDFKATLEATKDSAIDFESMSDIEKNNLTPRNMVNRVTTKEADLDDIQWQNEGNSTDVYRIRLKDEAGKHYYLKENLPFINEDLPGFLDRRIRQLTVSRANVPLNDPVNHPVEDRLVTAGVTDADYENCITFLNTIKNTVDRTGEAQKYAEMNRLSGIFANNYDRIFDDLRKLNESVDIIQKYPEKTLDDLIEETTDSVQKEVLQFRKQFLIDSGMYDPAKPAPPSQKMSAADFVIKETGLDARKDAALIRQLKAMDDAAVQKMFRFTMGKEVELFGQMMESEKKNGAVKDEEKNQAAINNTATTRLAERYGFDDVITRSKTAMVKFKRRDGSVVNKLCTISEEAEGIELIDLMKKANNEGKQIVYSPEAMRNLMRLQAIDTLTLQKDRHGRNFKCDFTEKNGKLIINSVKAYDNDMSFENLDLEEAFGKDMENTRFQFLPSTNILVKNDSALFKHIVNNYFGVSTDKMADPNKKMEMDFGRYKLEIRNYFVVQLLLKGKDLAIGRKDFDDYRMGSRVKIKAEHKDNVDDYADKYVIGDPAEFEKILSDLRSTDDDIRHEARMRYYDFGPVGKEMDIMFARLFGDDEAEREKAKAELRVKFDEEAKEKFKERVGKLDSENEKERDDAEFEISQAAKVKYTDLFGKICKLWFKEKAVKADGFLGFVSLADVLKTDVIKELKPQEIKELDGYMKELKELDKTFDFKQFDDVTGNKVPLNAMRALIHAYDTTLGDNIKIRLIANSKNPEAALSLFDKNGNLKVPAMLHYDKEAYDKLQRSVVELADPNSMAVAQLKDLGFSDKKIEALRKRNQQMLDQIDEARETALNFYKACGWDKKPQNTFLLEKKDYKDLNNIFELTVDPGKTYLAIDNEHFLAGCKDYAKFMDDREKSEAQNYCDSLNKDKKRWKFKPEDKKLEYRKNPVSAESSVAKDGIEYLKACKQDEQYLRNTEPQNKDKVFNSVCETIYINTLLTNAEKGKIKITTDKAREQLAEDSAGRKVFDVYRGGKAPEKENIVAKTFYDNLRKLVNEAKDPVTDSKVNELRDNALRKTMKIMLAGIDAAVDKDTVKNKEKFIDRVSDILKFSGNLSKAIGSNVSAEAEFAEHVAKNPGKLPEDILNRIKEKLAAKPVQHEKKEVKNEKTVIKK